VHGEVRRVRSIVIRETNLDDAVIGFVERETESEFSGRGACFAGVVEGLL